MRRAQRDSSFLKYSALAGDGRTAAAQRTFVLRVRIVPSIAGGAGRAWFSADIAGRFIDRRRPQATYLWAPCAPKYHV